MIRDVEGEDEGAGFVQLGEEKAERGIIAYLLLPPGWLQRRGSHSSFSEMHSDRLRGSRHSLRQRKFQLDMRKGS